MTNPDLPPPNGPRRFLRGSTQKLSTLKDHRAALWVRENAMFVAALVLLLFVGLLSLLGQTNTINPNDPTFTPNIVATETAPIFEPDSLTLTAQPPSMELTPGTLEPTPTSIDIGPNPVTPSAAGGIPTTNPDDILDLLTPYPGEDESPFTFPTFPAGPDEEPTTDIFPTLGPPTSGFPPTRPTATSGALPTLPVINDDEDPDQQLPTSDPYPNPSEPDSTPTLIPTFDDPIDDEPTNIPPILDPEETPTPEATPTPEFTPTPEATPTPTLTPTPSADRLSGSTRWGLAQSPVFLRRETIIPQGSTLTIDAGVEVQLAPGASLVVDGTLNANGAPGALVRFRKTAQGNWNSIVVNPGGIARLNRVDLQGGGAGGVIIGAFGGDTIISDSFIEAKGQILGAGGNLDMQRTTVVGIAPLSISVPSGGVLRLLNNSITNLATDGATGVNVSARTGDVVVEIEGNYIGGSTGINLQTRLDQPVAASIQCNTFENGAIGLSIKTSNPALNTSILVIKFNSFLNHEVYGVSSDVGVDGRNNWWGDPSGPYNTEVNANGTGDAVGVNVPFIPWLKTKPDCSP